MTQTITQYNPGVRTNFAAGAILDTGTVAAMKITLGWKPRYVRILNVTGLVVEEWVEGMSDANGFLGIDSGAGAVDYSLITSNGITPADDGFTIGLNTDVLVSSEQLHWVAFG